VRADRHFGRARLGGAGAAGVIVLAALGSPGTAHGQERRVALLDADPPIASALIVALSPWQLGVVPATGPVPPPDLETASTRARDIATDQRADVVVWIQGPARAGERGSLWVYDTASQQIVVRPLTVAPPFGAAAAAAVALSVKTILRASPLVAQFTQPGGDEGAAGGGAGGASAGAGASTGAGATAGAGTGAGATAGAGAGASGGRDETARGASGAGSESGSGRDDGSQGAWRFETTVGARTPTGASAAAEPWGAIGLSLWPWQQHGHLGLGLDVKGGSGVSVSGPMAQGEYRQGALDATVRLRTAATGWLSFELRAGPELALTSFSAQPGAGASLNAVRVNPAFDFGGVVDFAAWTRVSLGVVGDAVALARFQRYALGGTSLLDEPPLSLLLGLRLSVEVD
jgi:hypothetical protein